MEDTELFDESQYNTSPNYWRIYRDNANDTTNHQLYGSLSTNTTWLVFINQSSFIGISFCPGKLASLHLAKHTKITVSGLR